jgi:hypothetical protein
MVAVIIISTVVVGTALWILASLIREGDKKK